MRPLIFIRNPFNYDRNKASVSSGLSCSDEHRTDQSFIAECDINTIVDRFGITGQLPENVRTPLEGDFSEVTDYQTAINMVIAADVAFAEMPSRVRERFNNDPARFVAFASDPANLDECRKLGLANPPAREPAPITVRLAQEPAEGGGPAPKSSRGGKPAGEAGNAPE